MGLGATIIQGEIQRRIAAIVGSVLLLIVIGLLGWALRLDHLRAGWKSGHETLTAQAAGVLVALRSASDNSELTWAGAGGQALALGDSNRTLKVAIAEQNATIDDMAREAVRLRARADELKALADRARAQRAAALKELGNMAATPGTRDDCLTLLREAEDALDLIYEAGL